VNAPADVRRWRRHLAAERSEANVYRELAARRDGEDHEILFALAEAEDRHAQHWIDLLGPAALPDPRPDAGSRLLGWFAKRFGSVFVLALMQRAENRSPYDTDADATDAMAADERIHGEVVAALASAKRLQLAGGFRAAVFGMNDGLVSNLALVLGAIGTGLPAPLVLFTGIAGLLAGSLSMAAGEFVSVSSQRELIDASRTQAEPQGTLEALDLDANELALVYRARGMDAATAERKAAELLRRRRWAKDGGRQTAEGHTLAPTPTGAIPVPAWGPEAAQTGEPSRSPVVMPAESHDAVGSPLTAALSSFLAFAAGALIPVLPMLFGAEGLLSVALSAGLVGVALLSTGAITGVLSGTSPLLRALRQLAIGFGAAGATYLLGLAFAGLGVTGTAG